MSSKTAFGNETQMCYEKHSNQYIIVQS